MSVVWAACGSSDRSVDGDAKPHEATCNTAVVMHCTDADRVACHQFYSNVAADAARSGCSQLGDTIGDGQCFAEFDRCCIDIDGSNGYPEGSA